MARPKVIDNAVRVSLVLSREQHERIAHMARKMGVQLGRTITSSEAIRMAIEQVYPVPKQEQMGLKF